jgi:hypothetical protein
MEKLCITVEELAERLGIGHPGKKTDKKDAQ